MRKITEFEGVPVYSSSSRLNSASYEKIYEVLLKYSRKLNLKPMYFIISYHYTKLEVLKDSKSITIFVEGNNTSKIYSTGIIKSELEQLTLFQLK